MRERSCKSGLVPILYFDFPPKALHQRELPIPNSNLTRKFVSRQVNFLRHRFQSRPILLLGSSPSKVSQVEVEVEVEVDPTRLRNIYKLTNLQHIGQVGIQLQGIAYILATYVYASAALTYSYSRTMSLFVFLVTSSTLFGTAPSLTSVIAPPQ
ncbi:hypothetical protein F4774DRAFT_41488 [Daldinia eschscholtzii]|nr:hypothetical protein F4774DRAFT_41488 [Daldinia eschscholtzii]